MSSDFASGGPINPYGDLSRRARRELEAKGIDPDAALETYNQTGDIQVLTGSITIIPPVAQPAPVEVAPVAQPEPATPPAPAAPPAPAYAPPAAIVPPRPVVVPPAPPVAQAPSPAAPSPAVTAPELSPVPAQSMFPQTLSRRDEVILEQRRTAEIPVVDSQSIKEPEAATVEPIEVQATEVQATEVQAEAEEIVPIDLEPVEIEAVRIDQREDREEITNEFEPFTITTTSTGVIPTTSHALVLPTLPEEDPNLIAALNSTGEIVITGQITLPTGIAQSGAETASIDTSDIDLIIEDDEVGSGQDLAPVSASQAISSFTGTAINVTVPKRSSEKLPVILAISAAILALGVVGLFVANYFLRVF